METTGTRVRRTVLAAALALASGAAGQTLDRTVLPIPEPKRPLYTELDARNAKHS